MGLQVFHFHTTGYEIDMKQKKVWKKYFFNKTKRMEIFNKENGNIYVLFNSSVAKATNIRLSSLKNQ